MATTKVRLHSFDQVERALAKLGGASLSPTAGHGLLHCAGSVESSMHGYPALKPAIVRGTVGKLVKRIFLARGYMSHDTDAGTPGAPPLPKDTPLGEAVARLRAAIAEFRSFRGPMQPHVVYGACTKAEYEKIHAMHIANHLENDGFEGY